MDNYKVKNMTSLTSSFIPSPRIIAVKFDTFSINLSNTSVPDVNFAILPVETSSGTGYPPVKHSILCENLLWIAREGGAVEAFDMDEQKLTDTVVFPFPEGHTLIGLFTSSENGGLLAVSNKGDLAFWTMESKTPSLFSLPSVTEIQSVAKDANHLAVGGTGIKNNLKVFDISDPSNPTLVYSAKPTMNTRLNSHFPVDIRAICFTTSSPANLATASPDGQVFLYDFTRQSSSILHRQVLPKRSVITSIARAEKDGSVIYTDVTGVIECFDLLIGKSYGRFKPQEGTVQASLLHNSVLITASKDRFLRIFNYTTRTLLHKIYLKHAPATITISRQDWLKIDAQQYEDSEDEQVWEGMSRIPDKKRARID